ncbi:hypothetical protein L1987_13384 [Smallanthus sonchifolius]|uniref:Uncharacterized protein n=1 Tax=Smallanthus sonchifolius TaxID=185202 RepID=A0ACB9JIQ8_9ASTR|nr:hypothetical protein L1987_13384 [Smallanthus sonchifolius]
MSAILKRKGNTTPPETGTIPEDGEGFSISFLSANPNLHLLQSLTTPSPFTDSFSLYASSVFISKIKSQLFSFLLQLSPSITDYRFRHQRWSSPLDPPVLRTKGARLAFGVRFPDRPSFVKKEMVLVYMGF